MWAPWGAAATCRVASAAACPGSAAHAATSVPQATGALARAAAQVSVGSQLGALGQGCAAGPVGEGRKQLAAEQCAQWHVDEHSWNKTTPSPVSRAVKAQSDSVFLNPAECECRGGSCDPRTGECTCPNGLTGKQCDVCLRQHEILVANGPDSMKCEGVCPTGKEGREAWDRSCADCCVAPQCVTAVSCSCWRTCRTSRCPSRPSAASWSPSTPAPSPGLASTASTAPSWPLLYVGGFTSPSARGYWPVGLI